VEKLYIIEKPNMPRANTMASTLHTKTINGKPVLFPNMIESFDGFYISYNNYDTLIYGCDTTAIVAGQMEKLFILNGDHRKELHRIANKKGMAGCLEYFKENISLMSKFSDTPA